MKLALLFALVFLGCDDNPTDCKPMVTSCILRPATDNGPNDWLILGPGATHAARVNEAIPSVAEGLRATAPSQTEAFTLTDTPANFTEALVGRVFIFHQLTGVFSGPGYLSGFILGTAGHSPIGGGGVVGIGLALNVYEFSGGAEPITKAMADAMVITIDSHGGSWPLGGQYDIFTVWVELTYEVDPEALEVLGNARTGVAAARGQMGSAQASATSGQCAGNARPGITFAYAKPDQVVGN